MVNGAPETLDTLKELADALNNQPDAIATLTATIGQKADKTALDELAALVETNKGSADAVKGRVDDLEALLAGFGGVDEPATVKDALAELQATLNTKVDQNAVDTTVATSIAKLALSGSENDSNLTISLDFTNGASVVELGKVDIPVVTVDEVNTIIQNLDKEVQ